MSNKIDKSTTDNKDNIRNVFWKKEDEEILKDWGDKAQCYEWMHNKGYQYYKNKSIWYTIPVIIISTITGTANFAQDRFGDGVKNYVVMAIGTLSIIAGIITTVSQFLKINELNEGHRVATLSWGKFNRNIKTELTKHPLDRKTPELIIKVSKDEFDRLIEVSPAIPKNIISQFNTLYGKDDSFTKPDICGSKFGTHIYSLSDTERELMIQNILNKKETSQHPVKNAKEIEEDNKINQFKETYYNLNNRYPTEEEIKMIFQPIFQEPIESPIDKKFKLTIKPNTRNSFNKRKQSILNINDSDSDSGSNNISSDNISSNNVMKKYNSDISETIQLNNSDSDTDNSNSVNTNKKNVTINENNDTNDDYEYDNRFLKLNNDDDSDNSNNSDNNNDNPNDIVV